MSEAIAPTIEVADLKKSYRNGILRRSFPALKGVSFAVQPGEIFGLLGPNGAGKTTLIKILLGIVRGSGGTASLLGRPAGHRQSRRRVGYLPENLRIANHHTARTAMQYYGCLSGLRSQQIRQRQSELLDLVGLADRTRDSIKKYSKGMLQRLGLAQALIHNPDLLILDEPTDGLDPVGRSQVRTILRQLKAEGKTVFLNSHLLQEVEMICDRVAILDRGVVRAIGAVNEIAPRQEEGVELELTVAGSESQVQSAVGERGLNRWEQLPDGQHTLQLRVIDQSAVDEVIDDMRQHEISIIGIQRRRFTLEDAFLSLFGDEQTAGQ